MASCFFMVLTFFYCYTVHYASHRHCAFQTWVSTFKQSLWKCLWNQSTKCCILDNTHLKFATDYCLSSWLLVIWLKHFFLKFDFLLAVYTWHCLETWILGGEDQSGYLEKFGILEAIFNTFIFTLGSIGFFGCSFNICCEFKREKILFWTCYTEALRRWLYGRTEFVSTLAVPSDSLFTFGTGQRMKITDGEEKMSSCFLFEMWKTKAWTDLTHLVCFCF